MNYSLLISKYSFFYILWITFAEYPGIGTVEKWKIVLMCNIWIKKGHARDKKIVFFLFLWWKDELKEKLEELSWNHGLPPKTDNKIKKKNNKPHKEKNNPQGNPQPEIH